ncbi:MAG: hypothetical protein IID52_02015 [Proteobacteria bacterium]|nr:hypothetical protein [Pseudomonadota bacterium]
MAAPKKKTPAKAKAAKPRAVPKTALAKKDDPVQDTIALVRGFQLNTLIALGLAIVFLLFQLFPETRFNWLLNIPVAALSGYLFWRQGNETKDIEQKVCRYGLLAVVAVFLWRDINISMTLAEYIN